MRLSTLHLISATLLFSAVTLSALPVHETGLGVRSVGLSGAATTSSCHDAVFSNPGGLAFMKQRYFFGGLSFIQQNATFSIDGRNTDDALRRFRFAPAGITLPIPVDKGGLTFAFAFYRPYIFDDMINYTQRFTDSHDTPVTVKRDYSTFGGLSYWSASAALQVAPGLGIGCTFSFINGKEDTRFTFLRTDDGSITDTFSNDFHDHYSRTFKGFELRTGLLYRPIRRLRVGLRLTIPKFIQFEESVSGFVPYDNREKSAYSYDTTGWLYTSLEAGAGVSYRSHFGTLFFDFHGRAPYTALHPNDDIPEGSDAARSKYGFSTAIRTPYLKKIIAFSLGYSFDLYDTHRMVNRYKDADMPDWEASVSKAAININGASVGITIETGTAGFDAGYRLRMWRLDTEAAAGETVQENRMLNEPVASIRWRF